MTYLKHPLDIEEDVESLQRKLEASGYVFNSNVVALLSIVADLAMQVTRLSQELENHSHLHHHWKE